MSKYFPGLRTIKTALAITFCAVTISIFGMITKQDISYFYAALTVIFVMQQTPKESKKQMHARLVGTLIGGLVALFITFLRIDIFNHNLDFLFLFIGIIAVIQVLNLMNFKSGVIIATIMMLASFGDSENTYAFYIMFRCLETIYGAYVAYFINKYFFPIKK